jgi:AraC-like DNA-binding protein
MIAPSSKPLARARRRLCRLHRPLPAKRVPSASYLAHRDRLIATARAYYQAHRPEILARQRAAYTKSPRKYIRRVQLSQARRRRAQQAA